MKLCSFICALALAAFKIAGNANAETVSLNQLSAKQVSNLVYLQKRFGPEHFLVDVAFCESSLEHTNDDGTVKRGVVDPRDTGLMQINKGYHLEEARRLGFDLETRSGNVGYAEHLYRTQGRQPWSASAPCHSKIDLPEVV